MNVAEAEWRNQSSLIIFSQFFIILALNMSDPYWPLILSSFHSFDPTALQYWSGAIYMAPYATMIFTTLLWTKLGERLGYKKMILRAGIVLATLQWSLYFLHNYWVIFNIRLLQGALAGFSTAAQAWSLAVTPISVHSQIVGRLQAATAMGGIIGPVCGGIIANYYGYLAIFVSSGFICLVITSNLAISIRENKARKILKEAIPLSRNEKRKNFLLFLICATQVARWMPTPFFTLYVTQQLHASNLLLGFVYASIAFALAMTTPSLGRVIDRKTTYNWAKRCLCLALILSGLVQCGFAFLRQTYYVLILGIFWGIGLGIISLVLFTLLVKNSDEYTRATAVGLGNTAFKLGNLLGIIAGTLVQAIGGHFVLSFIVIACFYFILAALAAFINNTTILR
jgi:MFS transporter, DHA1 family, staphyloferrin B biosynthesis exporter